MYYTPDHNIHLHAKYQTRINATRLKLNLNGMRTIRELRRLERLSVLIIIIGALSLITMIQSAIKFGVF